MKREVRGVYAHFINEVRDSKEGVNDLKRIINELADLGISILIPLAKDTKSGVSYNSKYIPKRFFKSIDIIYETSRICKEFSIEVHPWICLFVESDSKTSYILRKHPEWAFIDYYGNLIGALCPSNEEVRKFLLDMVREIIEKYDVNGINLDYVRTPGELCYCKNCINKFKKEFGKDPKSLKPGTEDWYLWEEWQRNNISSLVREIHDLTKEYGVKLSAYVWTSSSRYTVAQDWPAWVRKGYLDFIIPTGYVYSTDVFKWLCREARMIVADIIPTYICIGIRTSHGFLERPIDVATYVDIVRRTGLPGYVFFSLSSLLPMIPMLKELLKV